ncbi:MULTISPECIES: small acid-soluble spore protein Tlp [Bacillaceae]|uniref:small acid-soluble spore protein Tlp n=1 Tax=Bacillaceae TaxID=186817 RepID=UPI001E4BD410|nr:MULTISPECIES: small acid-soluble spore protein Tlp [Bacillaceae]MCE4050169.1 small acid-soluble spore protein Tlp [Bacillus sp. Au-Bac7]MCM3029404.1 small acid-soluble spore protein Tlp [Niallia sp. MER 6]
MTNNRPNPDNRADNVEKLQDMIENTLDNIDKSEETMAFASSEERANIEAKNKRREESINAFREEVKDEAANRENGYQ